MKTPLFLLLALLGCIPTTAQILDESFQSPLPLRSGLIYDIFAQADGKLLVGGDLTHFEGEQIPRLIRLHADGTLDNSFSFSYGDNKDIVMAIREYDASHFAVLIRKHHPIYSVGEEAVLVIIDNSGNIVNEAPTHVYATAISVHQTGKILVSSYSGLVMHNSDLTLAAEFNAKVANAITGQFSNDQILVAGSFTNINGTAINDIARLNMDGSIDNSFDPGSGTDDYIGALVVQPDGKIILGNTYINSFNGVPAHGTVRLNTDGSLDEGFNPPWFNGPIGVPVYTTGGIYIGGFLFDGNDTKDKLVRLNTTTGAIDNTFSPVTLDEFGAIDIQIALTGGKVIVNNTQSHGNVFGLSKVDDSGAFVTSFKPEIARLGTLTFGDIFNDKILVAGDFIRINGIESFGAARVNMDGSVDESFRLKENKGVVRQVELLDDENILISTYKHFFKLDTLGNERPTFSWSHFKNLWNVSKFEMLSDGKIMVADPNTIHRLHPNGDEDISFDKGELCCIGSTAFDFDMQGAKTIYGSAFESLGGVQVNRLARLDINGKVDQTFNIGIGPNDMITTIKVIDTDEIVVAGFFDSFDGQPTPNHLVKLSPDGALDLQFNTNLQNTNLDCSTFAMQRIEQFDSTLFFRTYFGVFALKLDGTLDTAFNMPAEVNSLNDIFLLKNQSSGGRSKSASGIMFALGNFNTEHATGEVMIKLDLAETTPTDTVPDPDPDTVTGVDEIDSNNHLGIQIYPQPVKDMLKLKVENSTGRHVATIYDISGKKYFENNLDVVDHHAEIDVTNTPSGVYVLSVIGADGKASVVKYIKSE